MAVDDRLVLISADCHAGANHETYREYLDPSYRDEFDRWRGQYSNPFRDLTRGDRDRNWNDERRISELEADGVVAEVVFPNTIPPFFPTGAVVARPPLPEEYELRLAGLRAHNRWLAEWCAAHPERRAGIGQIFLNDIDDAIAEVRWCHANGLRGGILLPPVPDDMKHLAPLYTDSYDRLWQECAELGVVVNVHSGGTGLPDYGPGPAAGQIWIAELTFFSRRPLSHMLLGGAFERFPGLRFVLTESGCSWIPDLLAQLDGYHAQARRTGRIGELKYDEDALLPKPPSEYFARNCWVGASFPSPLEAASRHAVGLDRYMWGSDYPHDESTYPDTLLGLRRSFQDAEPEELRGILGGTAASVYGFDLDALQPHADRCGPTVADIRAPYDGPPAGNRSPAFSRA
ncbi:MAG: amidohydrolase [Frankiaceae bacterium]|nr:amidohydrolase [Frankiaceae bacterium]MBV9872534.1 amidohydrolase [Frankiaceae bacterium]